MQLNKRALFFTVLGLLFASHAFAQSSLGIGSGGLTSPPATGGIFAWIYAEQQSFFKALQNAMITVRNGQGGTLFLIGLSFAYGVFHAAGPGHGKAVISSYMLANEIALKRGIFLSFASGFAQALTALILVGTLYVLLRGVATSMTQASYALEVVSYGVIILFGFYLLWTKARTLFVKSPASHEHHDHVHNHHNHNHDHDHHSHNHADEAHCETCGHSHAPDPTLLQDKTLSVKGAWSVIAAVGMRPCTGAIVVLSFALLNGLYLAGILSVLAMAIGTSITVSALASMAVFAKGMAMRYSSNAGSAKTIGNAIEITGSLLLITLGSALLIGALNA